MDIFAVRRLGRRGVAACGVPVALALMALLALAPGARGAELLYWSNSDTAAVSVANLDGSGGGFVNTAGIEIDNPEGMAYDPVTNRLFLSNEEGGPGNEGQINFINLDGSGAGVFTAPGAPVGGPTGITIDPVARTVYWVNRGSMDSLAWAKLDGSTGGVLSTEGATGFPDQIAIDPNGGRIYWFGFGANEASFARTDGSGGGDLSITGTSPPDFVAGVAVDTVGGRLYWSDTSDNRISSIRLTGGGGANLNLAGAPTAFSNGLAIDPTARRIYWPNFAGFGVGTEAFGFAALSGGGGAIDVSADFVEGPRSPVIIKSPTGVAAPAIAQGAGARRSELSCSNGAWAPDFPGSFFYQGPTRFAHQWTLNGAPVAGATAPRFNATSPGRYACVVTASNHAGSGAQTSTAIDLKAASFRLTARKKVTVAADGVAKLKVSAANQGDVPNQGATLCVKVPKKAKKDLKARKCKSLSDVGPDGSRALRLRVKVGPDATGTYKLKIVTKGAPAKAARVTLQVR